MKTTEQQLHEIALDEIYFRGGGSSRYIIFSRKEMELLAGALRTGDFDVNIIEVLYQDFGGHNVTRKYITAKDILYQEDARMILSLASQLRVRGCDGEISWRSMLPFSTLREFHEALRSRVVAMFQEDSISNRNDSKKVRRASPKGNRA